MVTETWERAHTLRKDCEYQNFTFVGNTVFVWFLVIFEPHVFGMMKAVK